MPRMKASCFEQSKTMSGGWPWPWPCLVVCYMLAVPSRNEGHTQPSKACPAIEQCKQLRYVCGARLMGQCRNCLGLSICMSLKKDICIGAGRRKGKSAGIPCHSCRRAGALCPVFWVRVATGTGKMWGWSNKGQREELSKDCSSLCSCCLWRTVVLSSAKRLQIMPV